MKTLREQILDLPPNEQLSTALYVIESLSGGNFSALYALKYGLTARESQIVAYLSQHIGKICTKEAIYAALYIDIHIELKIIDVFICKIRKKVPDWIKTHWGLGYSVDTKLSLGNIADYGDTINGTSPAIQELADLAKYQPRVSMVYKNRGHVWTIEEDNQLVNMVDSRSSMEAMIDEFERTERAIIKRMITLDIRTKFMHNRFRRIIVK